MDRSRPRPPLFDRCEYNVHHHLVDLVRVFIISKNNKNYEKNKKIVPPVAACLFKHIPSWRNIREIIVTNISFATSSDPEGRYPPLLENVPSLRLLYIGQATFLHPHAVAGMFCHASLTQLELVRLVDAYSESIWGSRLRRSDIEKAVKVICHTEEQTAVIACIKRVVTCEKKTERIMGGDRVDGTHILE